MHSTCTVRNAHKNEPVNHKVHNSPCAFISNAAILKTRKGMKVGRSVRSEGMSESEDKAGNIFDRRNTSNDEGELAGTSFMHCTVLHHTCRPYSVLAQTRGERSRPESTIAASKESMTESSTHTSDEELSMRCRLNKQFARDVEST